MAIQLLKDGLNTVVDEVVSGFGLDDIFPMSKLEKGAPKRFPANLDADEFAGMKIEFQAYENVGIRILEKTGGGVKNVTNLIVDSADLLKNVPTGKTYQATKSIFEKSEGLLNTLKDTVSSTVDSIKGSITEVFNRDLDKSESFSVVTTANMQHVGSWQIFLPQSISASYSSGWNKSELQFLGHALDTATKVIPGNVAATAKVLNGEVVNPQSELLFHGIDHRSFSYTFALMPKNAEETELIKELVEFFKCNMTPMISPNTATMALRYPNYFRIRYLKNGNDNPYLNKIAFCVLESFDVGYKDNGSSFHKDGSPTAVNISLRFKEIEPIYRQMICKGY